MLSARPLGESALKSQGHPSGRSGNFSLVRYWVWLPDVDSVYGQNNVEGFWQIAVVAARDSDSVLPLDGTSH